MYSQGEQIRTCVLLGQNIVKFAGIPIGVSLFILAWFYRVQHGDITITLFGVFDSQSVFRGMVDAGMRVLSHNSEQHVTGNVVGLLAISLPLIYTETPKYVATQFLLATVAGILIYTQYTNVAGFSVALGALTPISLHTYGRLLAREIRARETQRMRLVILGLTILFIYQSINQFVFDALLVLNIVSFENPGVGMYFIQSLSDTYTIDTAHVHLIGVTAGAIITLYTHNNTYSIT